MEVTYLAFGAGQCSSAMLFLGLEYDLIIFCDTGKELPLTYAWIDIVEQANSDKFVRLHTETKYPYPPLCTKHAKVEPTRRYLRSIGVTKAIKLLGFTIEERKRQMTKNSVKWIENRYPLIELGLSRKDCQKILLDKVGFIPPRSGCTTCKYFDRQHLIPGKAVDNQKTLYAYLLASNEA